MYEHDIQAEHTIFKRSKPPQAHCAMCGKTRHATATSRAVDHAICTFLRHLDISQTHHTHKPPRMSLRSSRECYRPSRVIDSQRMQKQVQKLSRIKPLCIVLTSRRRVCISNTKRFDFAQSTCSMCSFSIACNMKISSMLCLRDK